VADRTGKVKHANRRSFAWIGFERYFKNRTSLIELVKDGALRQFVQEALKRPAESASQEMRVLAPRPMLFRVYWTPFEDESQALALLRIEDITSEREETEELAKNQRIEALIRLAAGIAHEIGNPLNAIQIHLELLKQEILKFPKSKQKPLEDLAGILFSETKRLDQIVRSFLRTTRRPPLKFRRDSINETLQEAVRFLEPEIRRSGVRIKLLLDKDLPSFPIDKDRWYQVFFNLIKNALEAMPDGGELAVTTGFKDRLCMIRFKDGGEGIDEKDLPHIFEEYYTTKKEGSGLGLVQVYQTVVDHGGRIEVKSQPGKGSTFMMTLPIRQERLSLPQPNKERGTSS
jgi:signal transduction histidine kinase